jgi:hypothetical protein
MRGWAHRREAGRAVAASAAAALIAPLLAVATPAATDGASSSARPVRLGEAGLYVAGSTSDVRADALPFTPQYPLWSDGAVKRRWLQLPPGAFIDAKRADAWEYPRGTRLWKEFSVGRRIETRLIERLADGSWRFSTYVWNEEGSDALLAPAAGIAALPVRESPGGRYAIPSETDCRVCHEGPPVPVLGLGALQLSPDRDPLAPHAEGTGPDDVDLRSLVARGLLRNLPARLLQQPPAIAAASPVERAVLGHLHANCAHCHGESGDGSASVPVGLRLTQSGIPGRGDVERARRSMVDAPARYRVRGKHAATPLVTPGDAARSVLVLRMRARDPRVQMPPLGSAVADEASVALIERWIDDELRTTKEAPR